MKLKQVKSWGYVLQGLDVVQAAASRFDLLVVDTDTKREDVRRLQVKPDGSRRLVLAYLSVGEAETYRSYWGAVRGRDYVYSANPEWPGNHPVRFWSQGWQLIMGQTLDQLNRANFDGVYLDKTDVFHDLHRRFAPHRLIPDLPIMRDYMLAFIFRLHAETLSFQRPFDVVMQNTEDLLTSSVLVSTLSGVAKEELFEQNDKSALKLLQNTQKAGKPVFLVEYVGDEKLNRKRAADLGFVYYHAASDRQLHGLRKHNAQK